MSTVGKGDRDLATRGFGRRGWTGWTAAAVASKRIWSGRTSERVRNLVCHLTVKSFVVVVEREAELPNPKSARLDEST